jgi:hypothetical protein
MGHSFEALQGFDLVQGFDTNAIVDIDQAFVMPDRPFPLKGGKVLASSCLGSVPALLHDCLDPSMSCSLFERRAMQQFLITALSRFF